jgi:glycerophosphoryl diester phosphodiesterase
MTKTTSMLMLATLALGLAVHASEPSALPLLVAHRGLLRDAPENTLANFSACLELRLGFELDIRRTRDGHLVVLHDPDVARTTDGKGKVADLALAELRQLDAGRWFDPLFAAQRVPTLDEVFALIARYRLRAVLIALDIKVDDDSMAADVVRLAQKHGVQDQVVCIGLAIENPDLRRRLRASSAKMPIAVLAPSPDAVSKALAEPDADWIYVRFVPSAAQVAAIHGAGKRIFMSGPLVAGHEPGNWRQARSAGVDALLTDFPLQCRQSWRKQ